MWDQVPMCVDCFLSITCHKWAKVSVDYVWFSSGKGWTFIFLGGVSIIFVIDRLVSRTFPFQLSTCMRSEHCVIRVALGAVSGFSFDLITTLQIVLSRFRPLTGGFSFPCRKKWCCPFIKKESFLLPGGGLECFFLPLQAVLFPWSCWALCFPGFVDVWQCKEVLQVFFQRPLSSGQTSSEFSKGMVCIWRLLCVGRIGALGPCREFWDWFLNRTLPGPFSDRFIPTKGRWSWIFFWFYYLEKLSWHALEPFRGGG